MFINIISFGRFTVIGVFKGTEEDDAGRWEQKTRLFIISTHPVSNRPRTTGSSDATPCAFISESDDPEVSLLFSAVKRFFAP